MKYRSRYKYQLAEDESFQTSIKPVNTIDTTRIRLGVDGVLTVREGYAWDGTSGPCIDRKTNQRGSAGHDALYQLMRMELLDCELWRDADKDFINWIRDDGAWAVTAKVDLFGLKLANGRAARPVNRKKVHEAP